MLSFFMEFRRGGWRRQGSVRGNDGQAKVPTANLFSGKRTIFEYRSSPHHPFSAAENIHRVFVRYKAFISLKTPDRILSINTRPGHSAKPSVSFPKILRPPQQEKARHRLCITSSEDCQRKEFQPTADKNAGNAFLPNGGKNVPGRSTHPAGLCRTYP